jgi:hypothetical protein
MDPNHIRHHCPLWLDLRPLHSALKESASNSARAWSRRDNRASRRCGMAMYVILSKLSPDAFQDPKEFKKLADTVASRIRKQCPKTGGRVSSRSAASMWSTSWNRKTPTRSRGPRSLSAATVTQAPKRCQQLHGNNFSTTYKTAAGHKGKARFARLFPAHRRQC